MKQAVRALVGLSVALTVGALTVVYLQASAAKAKAVTPEQRQDRSDERLLRQLVTPDMSVAEAEAVPTYSDFARLLRDGVVKVVRSSESLKQSLDSGTDLLERYPPDGVPGRHLRAYLRQNSDWKVSTTRSLNEQISAIKNLRGDAYAYFLSHPEVYDRIGKRFEATIAEAIQLRRPAAGILQRYAATRATLAQRPTPVSKAEFANAESVYRAWRRSQ